MAKNRINLLVAGDEGSIWELLDEGYAGGLGVMGIE